MKKKYKLTKETIEHNGRTLHRIKALKDFNDVKKGELGGWIEKEENLSQEGNCWVHKFAKVYDDARIYNDAKILGFAQVYGNAKVYDDAIIFDNACVHNDAVIYGDAVVHGNALILGDAEISSNADYIVFKNWWSSGRYFTWTKSNNMWEVGCFYGTGEELIKEAYEDSEVKGREYERIVKYVEEINNKY